MQQPGGGQHLPMFGAGVLHAPIAVMQQARRGPALDGLKTIRITYRLRQSGLEGTGWTLVDLAIWAAGVGAVATLASGAGTAR